MDDIKRNKLKQEISNSLQEFIGRPNSPIVREQIEYRIKETIDNFFEKSN